MMLKIGVVAREIDRIPESIVLMRHIEQLTRQFLLDFIALANQNVDVGDQSTSSVSIQTLLDILIQQRTSLLNLVSGRLSQSSINLLHHIFEELLEPSLWKDIFDPTPENLRLVSAAATSFEQILAAKLL